MEDNSKKINEGFSGATKNFFNLNFVKKDQDKFIFSCSFPDACANPMGFVQGGMISAVLDDATSIAMISSYENKKAPLTTDLHLSLIHI